MLELLKKFEKAVTVTLVVMMAVVVLLATIELGWIIIKDIITPPVFLLEIEELLEIFGLFLLVLIGVELLETDVRLERRMIDLARFKSFVGAYPIPIRYGLTIGELAGFVRDGMKRELRLTVVKMKNYLRALWYDQTGLLWIAPSPNIPSLATAIVYPGMCLFEGTNLSEGRGTTQPFEMIVAPWLDGIKLAEELAGLKLEGVLFRPASFTPAFSKHQGQGCQGIQVHVTNRVRFQPVRVALHILSVIRRNHAADFQHLQQLFHFSDGRLQTLDDRVRPA